MTISLQVGILGLVLCVFGAVGCNAYDKVSLDEVYFNRVGNAMSNKELDAVPYSEFGFTWQDDDASTLKWRPQGVTSVSSDTKEYLAVSWYGRSQENYSDRGVRISFVNMPPNASAFSTVSYRHILLVDEDFNTFPSMHAGGLATAEDGSIHVPDSRSGTKKVYVFSTSYIYSIPSEDREKFYNYAYIMTRQGSYDVPITPSFLSYDWTRNQMLVGTFYQCSNYHYDTDACLVDSHTTLAWYDVKNVDANSPFCQPFFSEMQGALSSTENGSFVLWTTSSYGSSHESHLHIATLPSEQCSPTTDVSKTFRTLVYPPGLEDLHRSDPSSIYSPYIWMLTEFGSNDGSGNSRRVFAAEVKLLLP